MEQIFLYNVGQYKAQFSSEYYSNKAVIKDYIGKSY